MTTENSRADALTGPYTTRHTNVGDWLWCELMDYCKERGTPPSGSDRLFEIVGRARSAWDSVSSPQPAVVPIEEMIRFCPECGRLGDIPAGYEACCPDWSHARVVPKRFAELCAETFKICVNQPYPKAAPSPADERAPSIAAHLWMPADIPEPLEPPQDFGERKAYAFKDPAAGGHDPWYVVLPNMAALKLGYHADDATDKAHAEFIAAAINRAVSVRAVSANETVAEGFTYATKQATACASCGEHKHTPLRIDWMGGYVCLTCIDRELESRSPAMAAQPVAAWAHCDDPRDCISDAKKRDMIEHAGAGGRRLAEKYSIALGRIGAVPAMVAEACKTCGGSRVVDDGEITGSGGVEFENGPIKCVKDCPDCAAPLPAPTKAAGEAGAMPGTDGFTMAAFRAVDVPIGTKLYTAPQPAQANARIDVEAMLRACVPGGDICDPQRIADSIREWFDERGAQAAAREGLTDSDLRCIAQVLEGSGYVGTMSRVRALLQGAKQ